MNKDEIYYSMEAANGQTVRVPASKLEEWSKTQEAINEKKQKEQEPGQTLTKLQVLLTVYLKHLNLDEAAILFIMLALSSEASQEAMVLYLREHKNPTQEELMEVAAEFHELSAEMGFED